MTEIPTEREALLEARVKELEAAAAQRKTAGAGAGIVEQVWHYFTAFVPPWIIACGLAIFLGFHAWEYFNSAKILAAETETRKAKAAIDDLKGRVPSTLVDGTKAEVQRMAAEVAKKQNEASRAKVEADTQNAIIEGETARSQQLRAELAKKRALAGKAKLEAEAAGAKFGLQGLQTLAEREQRAKLIVTQMEAADSRFSAAIARTGGNDRAAILNAVCGNNQFPELIDCPASYVQHARRDAAARIALQTPPDPAQASSGQFARVNAPEYLNLRKCPKADDSECPGVRIPTGQRVKVLAHIENGWVQIEVAIPFGTTAKGYVNGKFLKPE
ncbi:SH3 domain-containing protein [Bradyrhizobium sp.]